MANVYIEISRRPCYVKEKRALFNCWCKESYIVPPSPMIGGHNGGVISNLFGVVEFEDGTVAKVFPEEIQFADGGGFGEYAFLPKDRNSGG